MRILSGEIACFFCWGNDPQLIVESPDLGSDDRLLLFEIVMRVEFTFEEISKLLAEHIDLQKEVARLRTAALKEDHSRTRLEWRVAAAETQIAFLQKENARLRITKTESN